MAFDTIIDKTKLESALTASANAIREKTGGTEPIAWLPDKGFAEAIGAIETGGGGATDEGWIKDGNTHVWISLQEGRTSPMLGVCPNGTVTVDWGDGTTPDVLTGTSVTSVKWTPTHNYASAGNYVISLSVDGEMGFYGEQNVKQGSALLRYTQSADNRNVVYLGFIRKVEIGKKTITRPYSFSLCATLAKVGIPEGVTYISNYAFNSCRLLIRVVMPEGVTSIYAGAFSSCNGARCYDFTACTTVPSLESTTAFTGIPDDCEIRVPAALYAEWVAATNWTTYASYIKAV